MNPRHSPTPWRADEKLIQSIVRGPVAVVRAGPRHDEFEAETNARRIVDCVNACAGIADPVNTLLMVRIRIKSVADQLRATDQGIIAELLEEALDKLGPAE